MSSIDVSERVAARFIKFAGRACHHAAMHEIELKFQVPAERRAALRLAVAGRQKGPRVRLQAAYFDTVDRALATNGLALRVRREGRRWVQTLKGSGSDGMTRAEHNVALDAPAGEAPPADPTLHDGSAVGERLRAALAAVAPPRLACVYRTDIWRTTRRLRTRSGVVELAYDEGVIEAGGQRLPVCELEIELLSGSPSAVIETARSWVARHGLWLDTRSKAERGDLLARAESVAPPRNQQAVVLSRDMSAAQALRRVLLSCLDQVSVNASQIASGSYEAEHVHQLRVGLRRLRTALRLFDADTTLADLAEPAAALFRQLGPARDRVAVVQPLERELSGALAAVGLAFEAPALAAPGDAAEPAALVRTAAAQSLLLALFAHTQAEPAPAVDGELPLRDELARRLNRWHRSVVADAARFAELDDAARHTLRKRAKHLRYGSEFAASLFARRRVRRMLKPLRALQDRLGVLIDVLIALAAYRERSASDPHALFAVGWLAARREALLRESLPDVTAFARASRFWK